MSQADDDKRLEELSTFYRSVRSIAMLQGYLPLDFVYVFGSEMVRVLGTCPHGDAEFLAMLDSLLATIREDVLEERARTLERALKRSKTEGTH